LRGCCHGDTPSQAWQRTSRVLSQAIPGEGEVKVYASSNAGRPQRRNEALADNENTRSSLTHGKSSHRRLVRETVVATSCRQGSGKPEIAGPNSVCTRLDRRRAFEIQEAARLLPATYRLRSPDLSCHAKISQHAMRGVYHCCPSRTESKLDRRDALQQIRHHKERNRIH